MIGLWPTGSVIRLGKVSSIKQINAREELYVSVASNVQVAALLYFLISLLTVLACFGSFYVLPKLVCPHFH